MNHRRWRNVKDRLTRYSIGAAGIGVVIALATIFIYLFSEVLPIFRGADVGPVVAYTVPADGEPVFVAADRHVAVGTRFEADGHVTFFDPADGSVVKRLALPIPDGVTTTSFGAAEPGRGLVAYGLSDGRALVVEFDYRITYPGDRRHVEPVIAFPLGEAPVLVAEGGEPLVAITIQQGNTGTGIVAASEDGTLRFARYSAQVSFLSGETELTRTAVTLPPTDFPVAYLLLDTSLRSIFAAARDGTIAYYDVSRQGSPVLRETRRIVRGADTELTALDFLLGTASLIAGGSNGSVRQWMLVRDDENVKSLALVRSFEPHAGEVLAIQPEYSRKGFVTADSQGEVAIHHATSGRTVYHQRFAGTPIAHAAVAPRNDALLAIGDDGRIHFAPLRNEHPEISWSTLWGKVWYEGRAEPEYVWQASSATDKFEPKFSLVPLSLGTIKAAFYAMLFAMPLAILGAVYSAYFMTPKLRGIVKPTIEIMEALPTVILGFLAGLWLAPFIERNLPSVFSLLLLLPVAILAAAWLWTRLPRRVRARVPDGWEAALLLVPILVTGWACVAASPLLERAFFDGDMRQWLTDVGVTYDQRNALVVGIAMGFAVIPTIFSIAEDAVFSVPKHLTHGSLALGATRWQTVTRVVLLTASPGIFSAVMIGLGRAIGETMIVLMATGNSPVVNFNVFEGMRTLSANIAVELPETAVGSTHFRILFLAALLLFGVTFVLNTIAEIVRQRLRARYSQL